MKKVKTSREFLSIKGIVFCSNTMSLLHLVVTFFFWLSLPAATTLKTHWKEQCKEKQLPVQNDSDDIRPYRSFDFWHLSFMFSYEIIYHKWWCVDSFKLDINFPKQATVMWLDTHGSKQIPAGISDGKQMLSFPQLL